MRYVPSPITTAVPKGLRAWLGTELRRIAGAFSSIDNVNLTVLAAEPARRQNGMIVYANGTDWNPGSGEGFYGREAGAWVKL